MLKRMAAWRVAMGREQKKDSRKAHEASIESPKGKVAKPSRFCPMQPPPRRGSLSPVQHLP